MPVDILSADSTALRSRSAHSRIVGTAICSMPLAIVPETDKHIKVSPRLPDGTCMDCGGVCPRIVQVAPQRTNSTKVKGGCPPSWQAIRHRCG